MSSAKETSSRRARGVFGSSRRDAHRGDRRFHWGLRLCALAVIAILGGIFFQLSKQASPVLSKMGLSFFISTEWDPVAESFGAGAFAYGTLVSSFLALLLSVPVSVGVALFLTELAPSRISLAIGFLVEMLAAVPSVVYGLWGIFVLAPWIRVSLGPLLRKFLGFLPLFQGPAYGVGMLAAGLILAIMITPTIASLCREVFRAVPVANREAALALGATRWESISWGVLGSSPSGILGAVVLGLGRALGETMAVTMVIGNRAEIAASLFAPAQTMASVIANEYAEASAEMHLSALAATGLALFLVSIVINTGARAVMRRVASGPKRGKLGTLSKTASIEVRP